MVFASSILLRSNPNNITLQLINAVKKLIMSGEMCAAYKTLLDKWKIFTL